MDIKDPGSYSIFTYAWVIGLAAWGGVVNYLRMLRSGDRRKFSLIALLGEMATSGFTGVLTFWLLESWGVDQLMSAALIGKRRSSIPKSTCA